MNRWVLLKHQVFVDSLPTFHYDFLVEKQKDCLTWKLFNIPKVNEGSFEIKKSSNHRLVWLTRVNYQLSNNRGLVKRVDYGTYIQISNQLDPVELKFILNGKLLRGLMTIKEKYCELTNNN